MALAENINCPFMAQSGASLPDPFQDDNAVNANDEGQLSVAEEDENNGQDVLDEFGSGIMKSNNLKLKEPCHTLAVSAVSLVSVDHYIRCYCFVLTDL